MNGERRTVSVVERRHPMLTAQQAGEVYAILVTMAGARDTEDQRQSFVHYLSRESHAEWRFQGSLGFGGKLYYDCWSPPRIGCYREDETPERRETTARTNERLTAWFAALSKNEETGR